MVYDSNSYLTQDQMNVNAQWLIGQLSAKGWKKESIAAALGNWQSESSINFGIWQGLDSSNLSGGFGLCQWTPSTKYTDWASSNGYGSDHPNGEVARLQYEVDNGVQWVPNGHAVRYGLSDAYNFSFSDFINNTGGYTCQELADAWMWNYEGPSNPDQPNRGTQAQYYYDNLDWTGSNNGGGGGSPSPTVDLIHLLLADTLNGWR